MTMKQVKEQAEKNAEEWGCTIELAEAVTQLMVQVMVMQTQIDPAFAAATRDFLRGGGDE